MEEVVGEVEDEFDTARRRPERLPDGLWRLRGEMPLVEVQERFGVDLPSEEAHTLGGLVMELLGRVALTGDVVEVQGCRLEVDGMTGHRIDMVLITPRREPAGGEGS